MTTETVETVETTGTEVSLGYYSGDEPSEFASYSLASMTDDPTNDMVSIRARRVTPRDRRIDAGQRQTKKIVRRMQGFLIEIVGSEAKVAFVEGDTVHEYYLPAHLLRESGITDENQPFQMDEFSEKTASSYTVGYEFQPLAKPDDAFQDSFSLDAERIRKRDLIFKAFEHAENRLP